MHTPLAPPAAADEVAGTVCRSPRMWNERVAKCVAGERPHRKAEARPEARAACAHSQLALTASLREGDSLRQARRCVPWWRITPTRPSIPPTLAYGDESRRIGRVRLAARLHRARPSIGRRVGWDSVQVDGLPPQWGGTILASWSLERAAVVRQRIRLQKAKVGVRPWAAARRPAGWGGASRIWPPSHEMALRGPSRGLHLSELNR